MTTKTDPPTPHPKPKPNFKAGRLVRLRALRGAAGSIEASVRVVLLGLKALLGLWLWSELDSARGADSVEAQRWDWSGSMLGLEWD